MTNAELLTSPEAGALLGKSARTVQRLVDRGELKPAQKLPGPNGAYLFRREDIEALAQGAA
jgi:excisionase family DNA binding protein